MRYSLGLYRVVGIASVTALIGIPISVSSKVQAQEAGQLTLPPDLTFDSSSVQFNKSRRVGSTLAALQNRFLRLPITQQDSPDEGLNSGIVTIEAIAAESVGALLSDLQSLGLEGGAAFGKLVSGRLPLSAVSAAEFLPTLQFISLSQPVRRVGIATNQGDTAMQTDLARVTFGVDGAGISIGILSDSYDQLGGEAADIASGDLPTDVLVLDDTGAGVNIDEGRAMAQLIHDIAPGASLLFRTAFNGRPDFAQGILDLAAAGADVIVDDIGYLDAPMFQDGVIAQAVDQVVANGVVYFSAAGNSESNSYEAPYLDSGITVDFGGGLVLTNLHAFDPTDPTGAASTVQELTLSNGQFLQFSVQWDQPFASSGGAGSASDIDVVLVDADMDIITGSANTNFGGDAVEIFSYQNTTGATQTVGLIIGVFGGPVPGRIKWINFGNVVPTENATNSSTSFGHPNAAGAIGVGAARYTNTPPLGVTPPLIEPFSSHGGLEILFDTAGNSQVPEDRDKPDLTAPDGVDTTFFGSGDFDGTGFPNFFGTSAAAPNAAALAALQLSCDPGLTPTNIWTQQTDTAIDMETGGFDNISGAGLVDGPAAMGLACAPPMVTLCNGEVVDVFIGNGDLTSTGDDVILGTPGADIINALGGNDTICGEGGADIINGGTGNDWIDGGAGDDEIRGNGGEDELYGGDGDDTIRGGGSDDQIFGEDGDDTILGQGGEDTIEGGDGVDDINGGGGNDTLSAGSGATVGTGKLVFGGSGVDNITGGPDADDLRGGNGNDIINGLGGDDFIAGGSGQDTIDSGDGDDTIIGGIARDTLSGGPGNDTIEGGSNSDTLNGNGGNDTLLGGSGNDDLFGDDGSDSLFGGAGDDDLDGGDSAGDECNGQGGIDTATAACEVVNTVP